MLIISSKNARFAQVAEMLIEKLSAICEIGHSEDKS